MGRIREEAIQIDPDRQTALELLLIKMHNFAVGKAVTEDVVQATLDNDDILDFTFGSVGEQVIGDVAIRGEMWDALKEDLGITQYTSDIVTRDLCGGIGMVKYTFELGNLRVFCTKNVSR